MVLVTDLELPELDFFAPDLKGARFHDAMAELSESGWLAGPPIGYFVLDREAAAFFLRNARRDVPRLGPARRRRPLRVRDRLRQAVPVADDRHRDGCAARGRAPAVRVVEPDPAPVRRPQPAGRARVHRARLRGVLRVGGRADRAAPRRSRRRPRLDPDRRGAGGRPAATSPSRPGPS